MNPTRVKLLAAATESLREDGIAGLSARAIANRADVNQALIFYHFGTVTALVDEACRLAADASADGYRERFAGVTSLRELLAIGRKLHEHERSVGNVAIMAQLMSGAQHDDALASAAKYALDRWYREIQPVVTKVLARSPIGAVVDADGLARAITAGFIGLELYEGVDPEHAAHALDALEGVGLLLESLDDLGPVARKAVRAKLT